MGMKMIKKFNSKFRGRVQRLQNFTGQGFKFREVIYMIDIWIIICQKIFMQDLNNVVFNCNI